MWKFVTRGVRESLERRICRTNVYSQSSQDNNGNEPKRLVTCDHLHISPTFSAFYHRCCGTKHLGPNNNEHQSKYDAKYTWVDAVGWSSILAVGYVVCQSLCIRRKLFEIDNTNIDKWSKKLLINSQIQASKLFNHILPLPRPKYILPESKESIESEDTAEVLIDNASSVEQPYGPITAKEALEEAIQKFSNTHEAIIGDLELSFGSKALKEKRYEDAIEHFTTGAKLSSPGSIFNLALCYELGLGTTVDYVMAAKYYKKAADKGHADAMYNLGVFHAQGKGGLRINLDAARQLFSEAAKQGQVQALEALQIEKSSKKRSNLKRDVEYSFKASSFNNSMKDSVGTKLINYNDGLTDFNNETIECDQFDFYDKSMNMNPTEVFLGILGINKRSAIPLISVGESGP